MFLPWAAKITILTGYFLNGMEFPFVFIVGMNQTHTEIEVIHQSMSLSQLYGRWRSRRSLGNVQQQCTQQRSFASGRVLLLVNLKRSPKTRNCAAWCYDAVFEGKGKYVFNPDPAFKMIPSVGVQSNAFGDCSGLTKVTLSSQMTAIAELSHSVVAARHVQPLKQYITLQPFDERGFP